MRFPDADAAAAVAPLLASADRFGSGPVSPISITGHPDTHAVAGVSDKGKQAVAAFTARGPFVLYQWGDASSTQTAAQIISATLDKQIPAIDQFQPTDVTELVNLPRDPSGLVTRTIQQKERRSINSAYAYDPHAAAAARMVARLTTLEAKGRPGQEGSTPTDPIPNLPGSQCVADDSTNTCYVTVDRYVIEAGQRELLDAQQLAAAQYRVLQSK